MAERSVDVLLVGGGVASARCSRILRRRGFDGTILLVGEERHPPYNRPPLSKELLRDDLSPDLAAVEPPPWYERHRVELQLGTRVSQLDAAGRSARLADGELIRFDRCLLATGAAPRMPPISGAEHAILLRTLDDAIALRERARAGVRAVVIGGGFIGVEAASSLAARGARVTVLELAPALWAGSLGVEVGGWARSRLQRAGVAVRTGVAVTRLDADAAWIGEAAIPADLVLAGVGVTPRDDIAGAAGLAVDDGIVTDASHATGANGIFAAGDVARVAGRRVEHWHAAREGGERAARAMLGEVVPPARAPWVFSEFAGQMLDVVGYAPSWDATRVLGDAESDRFAVAYLQGDRIAQLAMVNAPVPVESARAFVESGPSVRDLAALGLEGGALRGAEGG